MRFTCVESRSSDCNTLMPRQLRRQVGHVIGGEVTFPVGNLTGDTRERKSRKCRLVQWCLLIQVY
jgi:hypothetical protein